MMTRHPNSPYEFALRNSLLQEALRTSEDPWRIQEEYPTVLSCEFASNSFCLFDDSGKILAHANLLDTVFESRDGLRQIKVGCVGNVATHSNSRGQGLQKEIFSAIEAAAISRGLIGLFLWSDLSDFFRKLGFSAVGEERRWFVSPHEALDISKNLYSAKNPFSFSSSVLLQLLNLRNDSCQAEFLVKRRIDDFRSLLTIPGMQMFIGTSSPMPGIRQMDEIQGDMLRSLDSSLIESWYLVGKGADMKGVVHEWGAPSPSRLSNDLSNIYRVLDQFMVLAPVSTNTELSSVLKRFSAHYESHPMALYKDLDKTLSMGNGINWQDRCFMWGLDSI